ncbi:ABC transporter substrate-binding protein [Polaromonas jejuensis]|uniref:ABC transporter substrate-binding protein n=1 Tax=Polaromonas jejuensis TaxID=457502 RepID=A0ABW0QDL4_9BURK|nr:sugar ABC transporter substrate-binding protein [Polaromonas jejuensis]
MTHGIDNQRRMLIQGAGGLGLAGLLPASFAQAGFDWKRYSGQSIEVHLVKSPRADLLQKYEKEFQTMTGITVGSEQVPEQQSRQKAVIEFNSGKTSFDVIHLSYHVQKRQFAKGKWLEDLRPYFASQAATDFDLKDFAAGGMFYATQTDGRIDSLPLNLDPWLLYYNKELFAAKGIQAPKTMADMLTAAKALHDPANGVYGMVGRGLKNANVPLWTTFFLGYGGSFTDASGKLLTDGPEAIASATLYRDLLKSNGPAGIAGFNWNESQSLFLQGKAAMWIDGSGFALPLEDTAKSKVVGKVGYGVIPAGPKAHLVSMFGDGVGVSAFTQKKGPAWYYVQWATGKLMQQRMLADGMGAPVRTSAYANKEALAALKLPVAWLQAVADSLRISRPGLPVIEPVNEFRDTFGIALNNILTGADVATEMKKATAEFQPVLNKSEGKS